jgi:putative toxin-antitoxin system antitoxin component (TIGR02293 family)
MGKAVEVMETEDNARRWVNSPQVGLGGAIPLDFAETEVGAREVEDLLGRIEHGVYS